MEPIPVKTDRIREAIAQAPGEMTMVVAHRLGVPEVEVVRRLPDGRSIELDPTRWEELIRSFEQFGRVHVIVSNSGATIEVAGRFGGFGWQGPFFNIQTSDLDIHLQSERIGAVFAVEKPSHLNGVPTLSIQFYDRDGGAIMKVFLNFGDRPSSACREAFDGTRQRFGFAPSGRHSSEDTEENTRT